MAAVHNLEFKKNINLCCDLYYMPFCFPVQNFNAICLK